MHNVRTYINITKNYVIHTMHSIICF